MKILVGKVAVVTGSGRGIGFEIGKTFLEQGARLVLADVDKTLLSEAQTRLGSSADILAVPCNVTDPDSVNQLVDQVVEHFGSLDILVNNAGVTRDNLLLRLKVEDWDFVINVNLKGAFLMTQATAKVMIKQKSGRIINISSVVGLMGNAGQANYSASKAGLIGLTKTCAKELAGRGITVNAIAPGYIATDMTKNLPEQAKALFLERIPLKREGLPEDIARAALFLASEWSSYVTGQVLQVDGGLLM